MASADEMKQRGDIRAFALTNGVPIPPMDAGVTDHVWKIDESVALLDRR
jgi:hypothetical protein